MPRLPVSMVKFLIKNAVLGVHWWKTPRFFPIRRCVYLLWRKYFSESTLLFLAVFSVQKTGCTPGRPPWLSDKSKGMFGFWTSWKIHFFNDFIFPNLSILKLFFIHMTLRISIHRFTLQFKHKCTYLFATNLIIKQYTMQEQS